MDLKSYIPDKIQNVIREKRREFREFKRTRFEDKITGEQIQEEFQNLGLNPEMDIFVHSSLKSLGNVEGGAETVIDSLKKTVTSNGTILMPAYPMSGSMKDYLESGHVFDVINDKSYMGIITETFRKSSEIQRSINVTHSVCSWGKRAAFYINEHHLSPSPCGRYSPFEKLSANENAYIFILGSPFGHHTFCHVIEDDEDFPVNVYLSQSYKGSYIDCNNQIFEMSIKVQNPELSKTRIDRDAETEKWFYNHLKKYNVMNEGMIGRAYCYLINAKKYTEALRDMAKKGITIYGDINKKEL